MKLIDGNALAAALRNEVKAEAKRLKHETGVETCLAVVLVGSDPASEIYVGRKVRAAEKAGIRSLQFRYPDSVDETTLVAKIEELNADSSVHGILVQLPLPKAIDAVRVMNAIDPAKDVDGFHPVNVGRLSISSSGLVPCTPLGIMRILDTVIDDYRGLKAVVIGKSNIVGKPVAMLLLDRECTVSITHIYTRDLASIARTADILVVAAGKAGLVPGDWIKPGAVVVDVGINRVETADGGSRIVGDVIAAEAMHAAAITPVPGGVGPMTIACLLANTVKASSALAGLVEAERKAA